MKRSGSASVNLLTSGNLYDRLLSVMQLYTTTQAAKRLGIGLKTLARYIAENKVPAPSFLKSGKITIHAWTEEEIESVRKLLPKIANGRKTRYQKLRQQQKAQPRAPAIQKNSKSKTKK